MVVLCSCFYCHRREAYWAADLLAVYGDMAVEDFGSGGCRCGGHDGTRTTTHYPSTNDVGRLELMRPAGWSKLWQWRKEWLELPIRPLEDMARETDPRELERRINPPKPPKYEDWTKPIGSNTRRRR